MHTVLCSPKDDDKAGGCGLWQYVLATEDDSVSINTPHTVCRTGADAYIEPKCSYFDCLNSTCTKCKDDVSSEDVKEVDAKPAAIAPEAV